MSYFEAVPGQNGLNALPDNPCKLLDFSLLALSDGQSYEAASADREIVAVILGGKASFRVDDCVFEQVGARPDVFSGKPHSVYIPAGSSYSITAKGSLQVGLCSA